MNDFISYLKSSSKAFMKKIISQPWDRELRTAAEDFVIAYDQAVERLENYQWIPIEQQPEKACKVLIMFKQKGGSGPHVISGQFVPYNGGLWTVESSVYAFFDKKCYIILDEIIKTAQ